MTPTFCRIDFIEAVDLLIYSASLFRNGDGYRNQRINYSFIDISLLYLLVSRQSQSANRAGDRKVLSIFRRSVQANRVGCRTSSLSIFLFMLRRNSSCRAWASSTLGDVIVLPVHVSDGHAAPDTCPHLNLTLPLAQRNTLPAKPLYKLQRDNVI